MRMEEKYVLNASARSTGDSTDKVLDMVKLGMADEMGCEQASKI